VLEKENGDGQETHNAHRWMAEDAADIVVLRDPEGRLLRINPAIERVLGWDARDIDDAKLAELVHPEDREAFISANRQPQQDETLSGIYRLRHRNGDYLWLETITRGSFVAETGKLQHCVSVSRDVTARHVMELEFRAAQQQIEHAIRAKSRFLANMSHELRTPLNTIIGFTDLMRQRTFGPLGNERYEEYATMIHDSGQLLLDLISDMMDMAKIEAGTLELAIAQVDLCASVDDCIRMLSDRAANSGLELTADLPDTPLYLSADQRSIKQILLNVLTNAVKFTPAGGHVGVQIHTNDGYAVVSVYDTGIGIPADELSGLGRPFERTGQDLMHTGSSNGLGLALVRTLTEKHRGKFTIASEEGVGTTVTLCFPLDEAKQAAA
jgi:PAS domain S-box-containing protein